MNTKSMPTDAAAAGCIHDSDCAVDNKGEIVRSASVPAQFISAKIGRQHHSCMIRPTPVTATSCNELQATADVPHVATPEPCESPTASNFPICPIPANMSSSASRIRRFSSGSMSQLVSPKLSRMSPRLDQIKFAELDAYAEEVAHEARTCTNIQMAQMCKDWSLGGTNNEVGNSSALTTASSGIDTCSESSTDASSIIAASTGAVNSGIVATGSLSPSFAKFPSPLSLPSPSPPPSFSSPFNYTLGASSGTAPTAASCFRMVHRNRRASPRQTSLLSKTGPNASPAYSTSTASGGPSSPVSATSTGSIVSLPTGPQQAATLAKIALRPSTLMRCPAKRRHVSISLSASSILGEASKASPSSTSHLLMRAPRPPSGMDSDTSASSADECTEPDISGLEESDESASIVKKSRNDFPYAECSNNSPKCIEEKH